MWNRSGRNPYDWEINSDYTLESLMSFAMDEHLRLGQDVSVRQCLTMLPLKFIITYKNKEDYLIAKLKYPEI